MELEALKSQFHECFNNAGTLSGPVNLLKSLCEYLFKEEAKVESEFITITEFSKRYNCCSSSYLSGLYKHNPTLLRLFKKDDGMMLMINYKEFINFIKENPDYSKRIYNQMKEQNFYSEAQDANHIC